MRSGVRNLIVNVAGILLRLLLPVHTLDSWLNTGLRFVSAKSNRVLFLRRHRPINV